MWCRSARSFTSAVSGSDPPDRLVSSSPLLSAPSQPGSCRETVCLPSEAVILSHRLLVLVGTGPTCSARCAVPAGTPLVSCPTCTTTFSLGNPHDHRWHLGCILPKSASNHRADRPPRRRQTDTTANNRTHQRWEQRCRSIRRSADHSEGAALQVPSGERSDVDARLRPAAAEDRAAEQADLSACQ